jgi:phosphatidylglycerophosphatase A
MALLIAIAFHAWWGAERFSLLLVTLVLVGPAIWAATKTARLVEKKDPSLVVVDEVLGQWLTLLGATALRWKTLLAAFLLFRVFDIWKPWPVRKFEDLPEGLGIVADDIAAGLYGAIVLYIGEKLRIY